MNHTYRQIWSQRLGCCVAVAEHARSKGKKTTLGGTLLASVLLSTVLAGAGPLAWAGPAGGSVAAGTASFGQTGALTTIQQTSNKLVINWNSFNVGAGETVRFNQPSASAIALNRVTGAGASQIDGTLSANGQVWVLNPNGVLFGNSAQVNVGGLVASTLRLSDSQFLAGDYQFTGDGTQGSVRNQGRLSGGYVALLGSQVRNSGSGSISTPGGNTSLGAGEAITLNFDGQRLLGMQVNAGAYQALVDNQGLIQADDGTVRLSAVAKDVLLQTVVNNSGVIQARGIQSKGGIIELLGGFNGGTVQVGGTLDASSAQHDGGFVETSGAHVKVSDNALVTTLAPAGKTGTWLIDPDDFTISAGTSSPSGIGADTLASILTSVHVEVQTNAAGSSGNGDIFVNAPVIWNAPTKLTLSAYRNIVIGADITAQNANGKLALFYGQGAVAASNTASYSLSNGARINLQAGPNFITQLGSDGTPQTWTVITSLGSAGSTTGTDLQGINGALGGRYVLGADIDASATANWNSGAGFTPLGDGGLPFTGRLDGLGHSIGGLTINRPGTDFVGLFGYTSGTTIQNIGLLGGSVIGANFVGGLVGYNYSSSSVSNSYATGSVTGRHYVGGLVGLNFLSSVSNSYATGSVNGSDYVGGLLGSNSSSSISNSYATGRVTGRDLVGGLVGYNYSSSVSNSYAMGSVTGSSYVGGLVGVNDASSVSNSYAMGRVNGSGDVGGLVGFNFGSSVSNSHWDSVSTGQTAAVGNNINGTISNVTDISTSDRYNSTGYGHLGTWGSPVNGVAIATVGGTPTWVMIEGQTRPMLYSEYSTTIRNIHQLQLMAMNLGASYTLANNIDASETSGSNANGMWSSAGFSPLGDFNSPFTGRLDGLGHSISGLTINRPSTGSVGLIGTTFGATIQNIGLLGGSVTGSDSVGGLVGYNDSSSVSNSYATGSVTGSSFVGGLVGLNLFSSVSNSYSMGSVHGIGAVGGLVGLNLFSSVSNSYATGSVTGFDNVGGLVGYNDTSSVSNSYWDTELTGQSSSSGGGIGLNTAAMKLAASFSGWDLATNGGSSSVWRIYEGYTAPLLRNFLTSLTVTQSGASASRDYNGSRVVNGATLAYSSSPNSTLLGSRDVLAVSKDAGTRATWVDVYSTQQGYDITQTAGSVTINPLAVTLSNTARNTTYDGTSSYASLANATSFSTSAMVGSDAVSSVTQTVSGTGVTPSGVAQAGSFTATPSSAVLSTGNANNYLFTYTPATVTVDRANLSVSATPSLTGNVYNGNAYTGSYTTTALGSDASGIAVTGLATGTNAGTYSSNLALSGAVLANYNAPTITNANLVIDPKPVTLSNAARNVTYDASSSYASLANATSFSTSAMVGSDTVSSVTQTASGTGVTPSGVAQAGNFTATPSSAVLSTGNANNYLFTYTPAIVTVNAVGALTPSTSNPTGLADALAAAQRMSKMESTASESAPSDLSEILNAEAMP